MLSHFKVSHILLTGRYGHMLWIVLKGNHEKLLHLNGNYQRGNREKLNQRKCHDIIHLTICIYLQEVRSLMKSQKPEDLILALKTVGNAGYPDFISDIKPIIEDKSKSQIIRAQAIYSLRKITAYIPEAVS